MNKKDIIFDKPVYIGFTILEKSKLHMYNLHYNFFKNKYNDNAKLMYMDTDSLIYEIITNNIYSDLYENQHLFDLSIYNTSFPYYSNLNKGVLGTLKDEFPTG